MNTKTDVEIQRIKEYLVRVLENQSLGYEHFQRHNKYTSWLNRIVILNTVLLVAVVLLNKG